MEFCPIKQMAAHRPAALAVVTAAKQLTYAELSQEIETAATELRDLGLSISHILKFPATNALSSVVTIFAALRLGASVMPRQAGQSKAVEIQDSLDSSTVVVQTSGSTGSPRDIIHPLSQVVANTERQREFLGFGPDSSYVLSLPLHHVGGLAIPFRVFLAGGTLIVPEEMTTRSVLEAAKTATHISVVPRMLAELLTLPAKDFALEAILVGGQALGAELFEQARKSAFPILVSYGLTETFGMMVGAKLDHNLPSGASGRPLPGVSLKIDPDSKQISFDSPVAVATNDCGSIDTAGVVTIIGRRDRMFVSGGENIFPEVIEAAVMAHPLVVECAVLPQADGLWGQRPVACVVSRQELPSTELSQWLSHRLRPFERPDRIELLPELPKLSLGKIDYQKLLALLR